jgi:hypothetical protein
MDCTRFAEPTTVLVGLGFRPGSKARWKLMRCSPTCRRQAGTGHIRSLNACGAAIKGEIDAETARATFVAFARRNDILPSDTLSAISACRHLDPIRTLQFAERRER